MTLLAFILEYLIPLLIALLGLGIYVQSVRYEGIRAYALQVTGWVVWVLAWLYNIRGIVTELRLVWEAYNSAPFYERFKKVEPIIYEYSEPNSTKRLILGLPMDPDKLRTMAQNPKPFSEKEMVEKRGLCSEREFRKLKAEMKRRGMVAPKGTNWRQGDDLTAVGESIMSNIAAGKIKPSIRRLPHST